MSHMLKKLLIGGWLCALPILAPAYNQRDLLQKQAERNPLTNCLLPAQKWVAYPDYADRTGWETLLGENRAAYIKQGEAFLNYRWQVTCASDYLEFEKNGNRSRMETPMNQNCSAIAALMMAELAEGKGRFTEPLINGCYMTCEMTSWALSAHLSAQKSRRSLPEYDDQVIDLAAGDIGAMLSWIHYFFRETFDRVNPALSKRIRYEIDRRILKPYMAGNRYWWMAIGSSPERMVNNWNPWCNFNVLQCFLLVENDPAERVKAVTKGLASVDRFINYVKPDGACEEGPSYWGHAAGKLYDCLQLLYDATGGEIDLFGEPSVKAMGEYISRSYVGNDWVVNFADASAKNGMDIPLIYRFGKAVNSSEMMGFAAWLRQKQGNRFSVGGRDIARILRAADIDRELAGVTPLRQLPACTWYPETQFCYLTNGQGAFLAAKAGFNDESHNHNDVGTFSLYLNGRPILIDAGVGTYTRQTFSGERYSIWTMQSDYHNVPMINGVAQKKRTSVQSDGRRFRSGKKTILGQHRRGISPRGPSRKLVPELHARQPESRY